MFSAAVAVGLLAALPELVRSVHEDGWLALDQETWWAEGPEVAVEQSSDEQVVLSVHVPGVEVETVREGAREYKRISIPDEWRTEEVGEPELPVITRLVAIPKCDAVRVRVTSSESVPLPDWRIYPAPRPVRKRGNGDGYYVAEEFEIDRVAYSRDESFPGAWVRVIEVGRVRGVDVARIDVTPVRYNPSTDDVVAATDLTIVLEFEGSRGYERSGAGPLELACRGLVLNYDGAGGDPRGSRSTPGDTLWADDLQDCVNFGTDYLIIYDDWISAGDTLLGSFAQKKADFDCFNVAMIEIGDIGSGAQRDTLIHAFIETLYNAGGAEHTTDGLLGYVLLVGDAHEDSLDIRIPAYEVGYGDYPEQTDHQYSCVDGEDLYADVLLGRFCVGDASELEGVVRKTLDYEPATDDTWRRHVLLSCGFWSGESSSYHSSTHFLMDEIEDILPAEYTLGEVHAHEFGGGENQQYSAAQAANVDTLNKGIFIANFFCHGFPFGMYTFDPRDNECTLLDSLVASDVPLWISQSCLTARFEYEGSNPGWGAGCLTSYDCLGEMLTVVDTTGCVAYIGSTEDMRASWPLSADLFDAMFNESQYMVGQALVWAKLAWGSVGGYQYVNLLGDPALNLFLTIEEGYADTTTCDLVITTADVSVDPYLVNDGGTCTIAVHVKNFSNADATAVDVRIDVLDSQDDTVATYDRTISSLPAFSDSLLELLWEPDPVENGFSEAHGVFATADPDSEITEHFENNNTNTHPADVFVTRESPGFPVEDAFTGAGLFPFQIPSPPVLADLDNDGDFDIVFAIGFPGYSVYAYSSAGGFLWDYDLTGLRNYAPVACEIDGDEYPELVVCSAGSVHVLHGEPSPTGSRQYAAVAVGSPVSAPVMVDLKGGDGVPEACVLVDDSGSPVLKVIDFASAPAAVYWERSLGGSSYSAWGDPTSPLAAADLLVGGGPQLIVGDAVSDSLRLHCFNADSTLCWYSAIEPDTVGPLCQLFPANIAVADCDGDGDLEVIATSRAKGVVWVLNGDDGSEITSIQTDQDLQGSSIGDVDPTDDGLEIVVAAGAHGAGDGTPYVKVYPHDSSTASYWIEWDEGEPRAVTQPLIAGFDSDSDVEIIVGRCAYATSNSELTSELTILSIPTTGDTLEVEHAIPLLGVPSCPAVGDLDADGRQDLVVLTHDGTIHAFEYWSDSSGPSQWPRYQCNERNTGLYQQPYAGTLSVDVSWWGDIHMTGDVVVPDSVRLLVVPGTTVDVSADSDSEAAGRDTALCELIVEGELYCVGDDQGAIAFRSDASVAAAGEWYGVALEAGSVCTLASASLSDAYKSLWAIDPTSLDVEDASFLNQDVIGVHLQSCDDATFVVDCTITGADIGVRADTCATYVSGNAISDVDDYGILVYDDEGSVFRANDIDLPSSGGVVGIYVEDSSSAVKVNKNVIDLPDTTGTGIEIYNVASLAARVDSNRIDGPGAGSSSVNRGIRLRLTRASARWNRLYDCKYSFDILSSSASCPSLGSSSKPAKYGNNAADSLAFYYINVQSFANPHRISAEINWWGTSSPSSSKFNVSGGARIDWRPYLESDPNEAKSRSDSGHAAYRDYLAQNVPNPFNPITTIRYGIARQERVSLIVYNVAGRRVKTLIDGTLPAGDHIAVWDGMNDTGQRVASGVYFCRFEAGAFERTRALVLLK